MYYGLMFTTMFQDFGYLPVKILQVRLLKLQNQNWR